ncbi:MAG: hypothetical protein IT369_23310 [Candidatus Latescibacteria bacterium]|nr:hypothetical protein [Candidatus Latescibacterota bacterium]
MKLSRWAFAAALVAGSLRMASAHEPPGETYFAFQFPINAVPEIDGDVGDWAMVPRDVFEISVEKGNIVETVRGDAGNDLADFNARNLVAWNEQTNRVYSMAVNVDDNLDNDRPDPSNYNFDDAWHFVIDADHSGGDMYADDWTTLSEPEQQQLFYTTGQLYQIHLPPIDGYWAFMYIKATNWLTTGREFPFPEYLEIGWNRTGETGGPGVYTYEIKATPWQTWDWDGPTQSTIVDLQEGKVIHIGFLYKDYDLDDGRYDGSYDFPAVHNVWRNANLMADFELLPVDDSLFPTAVETDSWGRIKSRILTNN